MIFGSPPYFYFRFRRYGHRDGRFCLIFARIAQQSVLDGTNGLSSSNPCTYGRILRSELKPGVVLALDLRSVKPASDMLHYIYFLFCEVRAYLCITATDHLACRGHCRASPGHCPPPTGRWAVQSRPIPEGMTIFCLPTASTSQITA